MFAVKALLILTGPPTEPQAQWGTPRLFRPCRNNRSGFCQILLVVILGIIKCRGCQNFRGDGVIAGGAQIGFKISFAGLANSACSGENV